MFAVKQTDIQRILVLASTVKNLEINIMVKSILTPVGTGGKEGACKAKIKTKLFIKLTNEKPWFSEINK